MAVKKIPLTGKPAAAVEGEVVSLEAGIDGPPEKFTTTWYAGGLGEFRPTGATVVVTTKIGGDEIAATAHVARQRPAILWDTTGVPPGRREMFIRIFANQPVPFDVDGLTTFFNQPVLWGEGSIFVDVSAATTRGRDDVTKVTMRRADVPATSDQALWTMIRNTTNAMSFRSYSDFMETILCGHDVRDATIGAIRSERGPVTRRLSLPFPDVDAYRQLKVATEVFLMMNCGVNLPAADLSTPVLESEGRRYYRNVSSRDIQSIWSRYLDKIDDGNPALPYLAIIRRKLHDVPLVINPTNRVLEEDEKAIACLGILMNKLTSPCFLELIWSYWHEEGMLVQTMNAITWRFQNRRGPSEHDPLAMVEIDPLRPLNNFVWGYIQDEQHRLSVPRRAYEYDHHYGLTMLGKAVPQVRGADSRTRFLEAFHHLLFVCSVFLKEDDDTTVVADGFPVLNALKEVHLLLTQGAHNQYGDLPWAARQEMLMQQWLLARPEFRDFLPRRIMVDYPEEWMDSVETMKTLQGWTDTSVMHFRDLGVFGEQILLGIRFGAWPSVIESEQAANWVRYWRPEIQGYIHAYRAATGADLTDRVDATMPALLLKRRGAQQALPESARALGESRRLPDYPRGLPQAAQRSLPAKTTR